MARDFTVTLKSKELSAALARWLKGKAPDAVDIAVRAIAFRVVGETVRAITAGLDGTPKRVDTGRLRAAWRVAAQAADLPLTGLSSGPSEAGDGSASWSRRGSLSPQLTVSNNVEYARAVEFGSPSLAPGNHLTRALEVARRSIPGETGKGSVADAIVRAWEDG